ncbi:mitochondrial ribosomal death-associated protein 3-domain-containing protein [Halenospora varia]|nr:mitochondrial ribosomal death-associated protein 3-domain-containing protein [Halenospora varia]
MASQSLNCWRCLARPNISPSSALQLTSLRSFSTTSIRGAPVVKPKQHPGREKGLKASPRIKNKPKEKTGKPPAPGERKAVRKRIVLSNTNAIEVAEMEDLTKEMIDSGLRRAKKPMVHGEQPLEGMVEAPVPERTEEERRMVGKVVGLQGETVDGLRAVEAFKTTQGWGLFRRPGLLLREESVKLTKDMVAAAKEKESMRLVLDGPKQTGKSMMLLQSMANAFVKGWVVINIPEAQEVCNAINDYAAIPGTAPTLWAQPTYTANWLNQIGKANAKILSRIQIKGKYNLPIVIPPKTDLARLCELGTRDPDAAWQVFQVLWSELNQEGERPLLLAMDGLNYTMRESEYRDQENKKIHSHDLAIVQFFLDHLSGSKKLANGGAIIAATSRSHSPISISMELALKQQLEKQTAQKITQRDPFERKYDERVEKALSNVPAVKLGGLSKAEARGLMEYWAESGVLRQRVDEQTVAEKWALAGNGIIGEIQRGALRMRI